MAGYAEGKNVVADTASNTTATDKSLHSATRYVQNAVEGAVKTSQDATQNLVNKTMKQDPASSKH
jgi:hypothetical protein